MDIGRCQFGLGLAVSDNNNKNPTKKPVPQTR